MTRVTLIILLIIIFALSLSINYQCNTFTIDKDLFVNSITAFTTALLLFVNFAPDDVLKLFTNYKLFFAFISNQKILIQHKSININQSTKQTEKCFSIVVNLILKNTNRNNLKNAKIQWEYWDEEVTHLNPYLKWLLKDNSISVDLKSDCALQFIEIILPLNNKFKPVYKLTYYTLDSQTSKAEFEIKDTNKVGLFLSSDKFDKNYEVKLNYSLVNLVKLQNDLITINNEIFNLLYSYNPNFDENINKQNNINNFTNKYPSLVSDTYIKVLIDEIGNVFSNLNNSNKINEIKDYIYINLCKMPIPALDITLENLQIP